jgi:hypothetical protein
LKTGNWKIVPYSLKAREPERLSLRDEKSYPHPVATFFKSWHYIFKQFAEKTKVTNAKTKTAP